MKSKNYVALVLLMLTLCFNTSKAASWGDVGKYDISWYTNASDLYVSNAAELAGVAYLVNNNFTDFNRQTIHLNNNIDLSSNYWISIGKVKSFKGSINGHGYKISGIKFDSNESTMGFIGNMNGGIISSLNLAINLIANSYKTGLLVTNATNCTFQDININGSITYTNNKSLGSTGAHVTFYFGSVAGEASYCSFIDITSEFNQKLVFGSSNGSSMFGYIEVYAGSIVGYGSNANTYLRCEASSNFSNTIYGYVASNYYTTSGSSKIYCGGIVGYQSDIDSKMTSCFSKITSYDGSHLTGTYDTVAFNALGFGNFSGKIENSVAIVDKINIMGHSYSWVASWYHTHSNLSDSNYSNSIVGGCYMNSDVSKTTSKVGGDDITIYSSTAFTKQQMNSKSFVDELNFYSRLHMDGNEYWKIENGHLKLIHKDYNQAGIENIETDIDVIDLEKPYMIYNINGIWVNGDIDILPSGLYILVQGNKRTKIII